MVEKGKGTASQKRGTSPHIEDEVEVQRGKETSPKSHSTLAFQLSLLELDCCVWVS